MDYTPVPTIVPAVPFDVDADSTALRAAMKGFGTDEKVIINIITGRSNAQRQEIKNYFLREYGRDLINDFKNELGGRFEDVIKALMLPPATFICKEINDAMTGFGTNESVLIEMLCNKSNEEMAQIVSTYEEMYQRPLVEHICSETSGDFRRLLTLIITGVRDPVGTVDPKKAKEQAEALYAAGEAKLGTNEEVFNGILAHDSFAQLRLIFEDYKDLSGQTIEQAVKYDRRKDLRDALMTIVEYIQSPPAFFVNCLCKAMVGLGTKDTTLIRIIVSRSEIDLQNIKEEFERLFSRTLLSAIKSGTSGYYQSTLCAIIGN